VAFNVQQKVQFGSIPACGDYNEIGGFIQECGFNLAYGGTVLGVCFEFVQH
jgi:hypothetical protein